MINEQELIDAAMPVLSFLESSDGKLTGYESIGKTKGQFHITKKSAAEVDPMYGSMSNKEYLAALDANPELEGELARGYAGVVIKRNPYLLNLDMREAIGLMGTLWNSSTQKGLSKSARALIAAREDGDEFEIQKSRGAMLSNIDVIRADGQVMNGLVARSIALRDYISGDGDIQSYYPDVTDDNVGEFVSRIRNEKEQGVMMMAEASANKEARKVTSGMFSMPSLSFDYVQGFKNTFGGYFKDEPDVFDMFERKDD